MKKSVHPFYLAGLVLLSLAFHASAISGWWLADDAQVLVQAVRQSPREYFFVPRAWRYLSSSNFTPLVTLSFEADLQAAGLEPRVFYLHQLSALALAAVLLFLVLVPYAGEVPAFVGAAMFVTSPQAIVAARTLMVRHYVEGLIMALMALIFWRLGRDRKGVHSAILAVLCATSYLLAMLAKEIYIPLPLLMLLDSVAAPDGWRRRATRLVPVAASLILYVVWRLGMLGSMGGYGEPPEVRLSMLTDLWAKSMANAPSPLLWIVALALGLLALFALRSRALPTALFIAAALAFLLPPLIPVASQLDVRHGFGIFVFMTAGLALALAASGKGKLIPALAAAIALVTTMIAGQIVQRRVAETSRRQVAEGKYVWAGPSAGPLLLAQAPGWYLGGLSELRLRDGRGNGPRFLLSEDALAVEPVDLGRVISATATGGLTSLQPRQIAAVQAERSRFDARAPLFLVFERQDHRLRWRLGPPSSLAWTFLTYPGYDEYSIPETGSRTIPEPAERQFFRVRRHLPDGRWTITPPLLLPEAGRSVTWRTSGV